MYRKIRIGKYYLDIYRSLAAVGIVLVLLALLITLFKHPKNNDTIDSKSENPSITAEDSHVVQILDALPSPELLSNIANYKPVVDLKWSDIDEEDLNAENGLNYWDVLPGLDYGQCTGYVSWAVTNVYGIEDYPSSISYYENRNGGEYVDSHRLWLIENATLIGGATTETGEITYYGARYAPGDIIVFNNQADGSEGDFIQNYAVDTWGRYDEENDEVEGYFVHIAIVGSDTTLWQETIDPETGEIDTVAQAAGNLPPGQFNLHHDIESHMGIVNMLSPEQFISRNVPADDNDYSRSYEIYRVLALPSDS